jgi:hypothetical protein
VVGAAPWPVSSEVVATAFRTFQASRRPELLRSCGTILESAGAVAVPELLRLAVPDASETCARGKLALVARRGSRAELACYQLSDSRSEASLIACCNATAAAAAGQADRARLGLISLRVALPEAARLRVESWVGAPRHGGHRPVGQVWHGVRLALHEIHAGSRHVVVCTGALNPYLVVRLRERERIQGFSLEDALALWRRVGLGRERLASRMAVVGSGEESRRVRFFTCGEREHPSAPPSGLAVLSITAQRLGWRELTVARSVLTPAGVMEMPRVHRDPDGAATIRFPTILVALGSRPGPAA